MRPTRWQWLVLWLGTLWTLVVLAIAEEYVVRGVFAGLLVTGLLYWQLRPSNPPANPKGEEPENPVSAAFPEPVVSPGPVGVAGWLALFTVGVVVTPCIVLLLTPESVSSAEALGEALIVSGLLGVVVAFSVYVAIELVTHSPTAPRNAVVFMLIVVALSMLGEVAEPSPASPSNAGGALIYAIVWGLYFKKSKRVSATYDRSPLPGNRVVHRGAALATGLLTVLIGAVSFTSLENDVSAYQQLTPIEFIGSARRVSNTFDKEHSDASAASLKSSYETLEAVGPSQFTELQNAIRARSRFEGQIKLDDGSAAEVEVTLRQFFHSDGIAILQTICLPAYADCQALDALTDEAQGSVLGDLRSPLLTGVLPPGDCSVERETVGNSETESAACSYSEQGGAVITLTKLALEESRDALLSKPLSRRVKQTIVNAVGRP